MNSSLSKPNGSAVRIGLLYPSRDPLSPNNWSGTPAGLARGLETTGAEVVPISDELPAGLRHGVALTGRLAGTSRGATLDRSALRKRLRAWAFARRLESVRRLDIVVAMGTELYDLAELRSAGGVWVTYDDATLAQMWNNAESDIRNSGFESRFVDRWIQQQRASTLAADINCASTQWAARSLIDDYQISPAKVHVIGMGHRPKQTQDVDRCWNDPRFLFVGVDWRRKNGAAVVEAFRSVRNIVPTATLDLVGEHPDIQESGVNCHGFLSRNDPAAQEILNGLYARATAFVLPSTFDPSPIAYLEAASAGLPVIATTEGGGRELLGDGALCVAPDDPAALLTSMMTLTDTATARRIGAIAQRTAALSTWSHVAQGIRDATDPHLLAKGLRETLS